MVDILFIILVPFVLVELDINDAVVRNHQAVVEGS